MIVSARSRWLRPFSASMAARASAALGISTRANPRDWPVRDRTCTSAIVTAPNGSSPNLTGAQLVTLVNDIQPAGRHTAAWDGRNEHGMRMTNGMYFIHVRIGEQVRQVRVTFLQ